MNLDKLENIKKEDLQPIKIKISSYGGEVYELLGLWIGCGAYSKYGLCFRLNDEMPYILDTAVYLMD